MAHMLSSLSRPPSETGCVLGSTNKRHEPTDHPSTTHVTPTLPNTNINHGGREEVSLRQTCLEFASLGFRVIADEMRKRGRSMAEGWPAAAARTTNPMRHARPNGSRSCCAGHQRGMTPPTPRKLELLAPSTLRSRFIYPCWLVLLTLAACVCGCVLFVLQGRGSAGTR